MGLKEVIITNAIIGCGLLVLFLYYNYKRRVIDKTGKETK